MAERLLRFSGMFHMGVDIGLGLRSRSRTKSGICIGPDLSSINGGHLKHLSR